MPDKAIFTSTQPGPGSGSGYSRSSYFPGSTSVAASTGMLRYFSMAGAACGSGVTLANRQLHCVAQGIILWTLAAEPAALHYDGEIYAARRNSRPHPHIQLVEPHETGRQSRV